MQRALALLRRHDDYMTAGTMAMELGVPLYAAACAMEAAYQAGDVLYTQGLGWRALVDRPAPAPVAQEQDGLNLGGGA